jgi:hypothetical protein
LVNLYERRIRARTRTPGAFKSRQRAHKGGLGHCHNGGRIGSHGIASDSWAQYQAKSVRRTVLTSEAELLQSLPAATEPAVKQRIADALASAARMRSEPGADGMEQLAEKAHAEEHVRDHEMHRTHSLELASGGLQISIVLASISVLIELPVFMMTAGVLGFASVLYGLLTALSKV